MNEHKFDERIDSLYRLCISLKMDMNRFYVEHEDSDLFVRDRKSAAYAKFEGWSKKVEYPSHKEGEFFTLNADSKDECLKVLQFVGDVLSDVRIAVSGSF